MVNAGMPFIPLNQLAVANLRSQKVVMRPRNSQRGQNTVSRHSQQSCRDRRIVPASKCDDIAAVT
jgi:hypothetical protein